MRSIFLVNLPIGLAGLWLTWRYVTDMPRASCKLDLPGQAAAIGALGILAAALIEGGRLGWSDSRVIAAFGAAVLLAVLFLVHERRAEEPILPLSLFSRPMFARTSLILNPAVDLETVTGFAAPYNQGERLKRVRGAAAGRVGGPSDSV